MVYVIWSVVVWDVGLSEEINVYVKAMLWVVTVYISFIHEKVLIPII